MTNLTKKMNITRRIVFHAGHMLKDDTSKCHHPHGHEYVLEVTITGEIQLSGSNTGMILHFGDLKEIMMKNIHDLVDHKFIIQRSDPRFGNFIRAVGLMGVYVLEVPPTAENLINHFYSILEKVLPPGIAIARLKLQETYQCWAEI